jgi:hypothetical protein
VAESSDPFQLEPSESLPAGVPLISDDDPRRYWVLSNGRGWKLALGQNVRKAFPEVHAAKTGILFVGLYHGTAASVRPADGAVVDRVKLTPGNAVYWGEYGGLVVAEGELEIGVFEPGGKFLWRAGLGDVIETIELKDGVFELADASGRTGRYEARTGRAL